MTTELENVINDGYYSRIINAIHSTCRSLGYRMKSWCYCQEGTSGCVFTNKGKEKRKYTTYLDCFNYTNEPWFWQRKKVEPEGVAFVFEGCKEKKSHLSIINDAYEHSQRLRNLGSHEVENLHETIKFIGSIESHTELGPIECFVHGKGWDDCKGREEKTDFECKPGKNWGKRLNIPPVVRSVDYEEIARKIQAKS